MTEQQRQSGFTLLETILALALTALLIAMLSVMARQWILSWDFGRTSISDIAAVARAEDRLTKELRSAIPIRSQSQGLLFLGDANQILFVKEPDEADGTDHLVVIEYRNRDDLGITRRLAILDRQLPLVSQPFSEPIRLLDQRFQMALSFHFPVKNSVPSDAGQQFPDSVSVKFIQDHVKGYDPVTISIPVSIDQPCSTRPLIKQCQEKDPSGLDTKGSGLQQPASVPLKPKLTP